MFNKKKVVKDFKSMRFVSSFRVSPKREKLLFEKIKVDYKKNTYKKNFYLYEKGEIRKIKLHKRAEHVQFYDENTLLYIVKNKKKREKNHAGLYMYKICEKDAGFIFNFPFEVENLYFLDRNTIAILSSERRYGEVEKEEDFKHEITKIPFLSNGQGYTYNTINKLYLYNLTTKKLCPVSGEDEEVEGVEVDKEEKKIYYITHLEKDVQGMFTQVYSCEYTTLKKTCLYDKEDFACSYISRVEDKWILLGSYQKEYGINENPKFYILSKGELSLYADPRYSIGNSINSDVRYIVDETIQTVGNSIYFLMTVEEKSSIYCLKEGKIEVFFDLIFCVDGFALLKDSLMVYGFAQNSLQEIYSYKKGKLKKISQHSLNFAKHTKDYRMDTISYVSNGVEIKGYVLYPKRFDKKKKYPAILSVHGGPKTVYSPIFNYEMYLLSSLGYFVFFTNPHGSDGKSDIFADIRGRYGQEDYQDLMKFTEEVLQKYENIDKDRLGIMGGSYGGFMTNYVIGHTDRFKAAVTQRSISNWISFYATSDIGYYFTSDQNACEFDVETLWEMSPLSMYKQMRTPTLIIHSEEDYRCPLEQGVQLFTHLKLQGVKSKIVIYKGENHDLSRTGRPKNRVSRLEEICEWFEKNL